MVWFGSSCLKTPKVWVLQTNAPVISAVTGVSPAARWTVVLQINKIQGAANIPHCKDNCPHRSHILIKLYLSQNGIVVCRLRTNLLQRRGEQSG